MQIFTEDAAGRGSNSRVLILFSLIAMVPGIFWGIMRDLFAMRKTSEKQALKAPRVATALKERTT